MICKLFFQDLGVADEGEAGPGLDDLSHGEVELVSEVAENGEDHGPGEKRGEGVGEADNERVLVGVVPELVVGAVRGQGPEPNTQREEGLSHCCVPNLGRVKCVLCFISLCSSCFQEPLQQKQMFINHVDF